MGAAVAEAVGESAWQKALENAGNQGPYALMLAVLVGVIIYYWIIPKATADIEKTKTDAVANQDQAAAMKIIGNALDKMVDEQATHRVEQRRMVRFVCQAVEAAAKSDMPGTQSAIQSLRTLMED